MKKVLILLFISMLSANMIGQDSNSELLKKLVEKKVLTQQEADNLQKETKPTAKQRSLDETITKVREAFNTPYMQFGGYGMFLYQYKNTNAVKHSTEPRIVFLSLGGNLGGNLKYYLLYEFVNPMFHEFHIEWAPIKEFGIRFGQQKTPMSLENQLSLTVLETIFNTRSVSNLAGMSGDVIIPKNTSNSGGRDIGIRANGKLGENDLVEYTVGMFQGSGINTADNNNSKDFAGTLMFQPIKGFRIGGSAYFGEANYSINNTSPKDNHVRNRYMVSTDFKSDRLYCRAEWMKGKDGLIDKEGLYGTTSYYITPKKLQALAKVDYYNKDKDFNQEVIDYTVGINYYFYNQCRLQLNYTYSDFSNKWDEKNSSLVAGQLQIVF